VCALRVFVALPRRSMARTPSVDDADKGRALGVCITCVCHVATSPRGQDAFG
jgi:hypothetical protein